MSTQPTTPGPYRPGPTPLAQASKTRAARPRPAHAHVAQAPDELLLGRYRVLARRGTGGFGVVCTCWDTRLQRRVAIKRLPLAAGTTTATAALSEARTACMLAHPNIVAVHDFETDGAYAYLVMEFVDGLNLAELLARVEGGTLTYEECAHMLAGVASALAFAHENRVLHLDIKPTNIMVDRQGTVKLADFGMSTLASAAGYGDARGGTVGYMPPEQIEGRLVDERADIFSLAVVVWQALCGTDPFLAPTAAASEKLIERGPARPLSRDCPELAGTPEQILLQAMSAQPAERTPDVGELSGALLPFLGKQEAGKESLAALVAQSQEDDAEKPLASPGPSDLAWHERAPWLEPACERVLSAIVGFASVRLVLPALPLGAQGRALASLAVCALAAAWPPAASLATGAALVWALATTTPSAASFPLAMATAAALVLWWAAAGRKERLGSAALLLPCCLPSPTAGACLAGFALDPAPAALTGALGCVLGALVDAAQNAGFSALPTWAGLAAEASRPAFWVVAAGSAAAAGVSSAIALRGSVRAGIVGQAAGFACLAAFQLLAGGMENGGIWASHAMGQVLIALVLLVILCIATVLRGPLLEDQEGEDIDEFSE